MRYVVDSVRAAVEVEQTTISGGPASIIVGEAVDLILQWISFSLLKLSPTDDSQIREQLASFYWEFAYKGDLLKDKTGKKIQRLKLVVPRLNETIKLGEDDKRFQLYRPLLKGESFVFYRREPGSHNNGTWLFKNVLNSEEPLVPLKAQNFLQIYPGQKETLQALLVAKAPSALNPDQNGNGKWDQIIAFNAFHEKGFSRLATEETVYSDTVRKFIRSRPSHAVMAGSALIGSLSLTALLVGKVIGRLIIAPDFGVGVTLLSLIFYLMARATISTRVES